MLEENISGEALDGGSQLNPSSAEPTVGSVSASEAMTLAEINSALGQNFTTKEAAIKSWKDTNSYVGMKTEDIEKRVMEKVQATNRTDTLAKELEEMRKERFYDKNPQYADPSIRAIIEATGKNPAEAVELPAFKDVFSKVSGYDESQKLRTVLESNPRITSSRDALTKAREMQQSNPLAQGRDREEMEALATKAVMDLIQ